jgi:hypothetical protein
VFLQIKFKGTVPTVDQPRIFIILDIDPEITMGFSAASQSKSVGDGLAAVLPKDAGAWYTKRHLLKLNFCILSLVMFCK